MLSRRLVISPLVHRKQLTSRTQSVTIRNMAGKVEIRGKRMMDGCYCPLTKGKREVSFPNEFLNAVTRHFPPWYLQTMTQLVPIVLRNPEAVWDGVRDPDPGDDFGGYCFHKYFPNKVGNRGESLPNPTHQVLSVYCNADFSIFDMQWDESVVVDGIKVPVGYEKRFGKRVK